MTQFIRHILFWVTVFSVILPGAKPTVDFCVDLNGFLKEIIITDSLQNEIHLDQKGKIIQLSRKTRGGSHFRYEISGLDERQLFGGGIRKYDHYFRLSRYGTMKIGYDLIHEDIIDKIDIFDLHYHWIEPRKGEIEYINKVPIHKYNHSEKLDFIGNTVFYYRTTDDKLEYSRGRISDSTYYRIKFLIVEDDLIE